MTHSHLDHRQMTSGHLDYGTSHLTGNSTHEHQPFPDKISITMFVSKHQRV